MSNKKCTIRNFCRPNRNKREFYNMGDSKLKFTSGGGFFSLFGLPFLLAGLGVIFAGLSGKLTMEGGGPASPFFYLPFGGVFATVGACLVFGRAGTTLDADRRVLSTWWGLMFPFKKTDYDWDDFDWVRVTKKVVRSDKSTRITYPVELTGPKAEDVTVETLSGALEGRRVAEQVAKFMNLGLRDQSRGSEVVREAGTLDETVRERILRLGLDLKLEAPPSDAKSTLDTSSSGASFDIPAPGFGPLHIIGGVVMLFVGLFMAAFFGGPALGMFAEGGGARVMGGIWLLIGVGSFASFFFKFAKAASLVLASHKVSIDKDHLTLVSTHKFGSSKTVIPLDQLEELEVLGSQRSGGGMGFGRRLQAVSDDADFSFGQGLNQEELVWIKNTLEYMICKA